MKAFFLLAVVIAFLGCNSKSPEDSEQIQSLRIFLTENPENITGLHEAISVGESELAAQLISAYLSNELKEKYRAEWETETLVLDDYQLQFKYKKFGKKPPQGWSLYISMHGGGNAPPALNDQQWANQKKLYEPAEGIYMAPRAPTNTWNLWHQEHIDLFFERFIQLANAYENINTNRVYLTGYSAGGDGTYQLAPRMADWLAGAAMMAGHPNDASPLGLRNLPFAIQMGAEDSAYNRNTIAAEWGEKLDELQKNDPEGYVHKVDVYEGMGHWMERKDTAAFNWMGQFSRKAYPQKVVWKQSGVTHHRFYWLAVPANEAVKDAELVAVINGQTIRIEQAELVNHVVVRLNDLMLDLDKKITVEYKGEVVFNGKVKRSVSTVWKTLNERNDLNQYFSAEIELTLD
ncbi:hypothetical protein [uncultured Draconibacterium sp.]|uniref:hypothetical protein n=1 Tax=uncultured Draconibacterium sp. TaxID=1573823 RepID=UPI0025D4914F|nr:hypothetical protein [uncultured Draconibacterium sp.]